MENTLLNEEMVADTMEEITKVGLNKGLKVAIIGGATVLVGGVAYKKVVKPLVAKYKAKKAQSEVIPGEDHEFDNDIDPDDELK